MSLAEKYGFGKKWPWLGEVDIADVKIPDTRVTSVMPDELEEAFRGSIEAQGVLNPIKCIWDGQNILLVDGLHRLEETHRQRKSKVPAVVVPGTLKDVMLQNLTTGKLQGRGKVTDMIRVVKYLIDEEKMPIEEVALKTGYKLRYLEDLLAIANAHPDILLALDEEKISLGAAIELTRIPDQDAQLKCLWNAIQYRMTIKDVKELVDRTIEALEANKARKEQASQRTPREYVLLTCHLCEGKVPAKDMRTVFLCPHCMNVLWDIKIEAMKESKAAEKTESAQAEG